MGRKVNIGEKSKVNIKWNVLPMDYSHEAEENIRVKFAKKYGIPPKKLAQNFFEKVLGTIGDYLNFDNIELGLDIFNGTKDMVSGFFEKGKLHGGCTVTAMEEDPCEPSFRCQLRRGKRGATNRPL
mgnify:CR=1 FL=1